MSTVSEGGTGIQVLVNGNRVEGLLHASVVNSNCFSSDHYALTIALGTATSACIAFWSSLSTGFVEIDFVDGSPTAQPLISGMINSIVVDPIRGTMAMEGRDLSAF